MLLLQLAILSKHRSKLLLTILQLFYYLLCHMDVSFKIYVSVWLYIWVEKRPHWQGEIWSLNCRFENGLVWWWSFYAGVKCLGVSELCINLTGFEAFSFSQTQLVLSYLIAFCRTLNNMFIWISESLLAFFIVLPDTKKTKIEMHYMFLRAVFQDGSPVKFSIFKTSGIMPQTSAQMRYIKVGGFLLPSNTVLALFYCPIFSATIIWFKVWL